MIEKINMTVEKFFKSLPKLRKYNPVITRQGNIRLGHKSKGYTMCPLTALRKELTGKAGNIDDARNYFSFPGDSLSVSSHLTEAADNLQGHPTFISYRNRMLKGLGLK